MVFKLKRQKYQDRQRRSSLRQIPQQTELFKRNKTVKTTKKAISPVGSDRQRVHFLSQKRRKISTIFGLTILVLGLLLFLIFNFTFKVAVSPIGNLRQAVQEDRYTKVITDFLDNHFTQRFIFLLDDQQLEKYFLENSPEVKSAKLATGDKIGQTKFLLKMRQPIASWLVNGQQYYVDGQGVTFKSNYYPEPSLKIFDETGAPLEVGEVIVTQKVLSFIGKVIKRLETKGLKVIKVILPSGEMRRIDLVVDRAETIFKLSVDRPIGEQAEDLERAVNYFTERNLLPSYADLRLKNKAYYK